MAVSTQNATAGLSEAQLAQLWIRAGGPRKYAVVMAKIAGRESSGDPTAQNLNAGTGDHSIGLWQINQLAHHGRYGTDAQLQNPEVNARAAVALFNASKNQGVDPLSPWSTHNAAIDSKYIGAQAPVGAPVPGGSAPAAPRPSASSGVNPDDIRKSILSNYLTSQDPDNLLLKLGVLNPSGQTATEAVAPHLTSAPMPGGASEGGATHHYVNPFGASLKAPGRIDEGVDPTILGPIRAMGNAKVVALQHNFYKGQPYLVYQLKDGPHAGRYVYVSELVTPHVHPGQHVNAGDVIATGRGAIETGWAGGPAGGYMPLANHAQGGDYTEGKVTHPGQSFARLLARLGAHAANG